MMLPTDSKESYLYKLFIHISELFLPIAKWFLFYMCILTNKCVFTKDIVPNVHSIPFNAIIKYSDIRTSTTTNTNNLLKTNMNISDYYNTNTTNTTTILSNKKKYLVSAHFGTHGRQKKLRTILMKQCIAAINTNDCHFNFNTTIQTIERVPSLMFEKESAVFCLEPEGNI